MAASRILVIGPSWVGDMVLAQSLFKVMRMRQTEVCIDVAAPAWTLPLLERMPEIHQAIALPFRHGQLAVGERWRYGRILAERNYQQAILLTNSLKSAILPFAAGIERRTGFLGECRFGLLNDIRPLNPQALPRTVDRFVALALDKEESWTGELPLPRLKASAESASNCLQSLGGVMPDSPVLGLCPGAEYGAAKRWPYYAEVSQWALSRGWHVWLFGSEKDRTVTNEINAACGGRCLDLAGRTALGEAIDLMSLTTAVVSNDSGLMHVAAALDKPLVAIYGSSDPGHTPPMSRQAKVLYLGLECSPCFKRECPLGHLRCLRDIAPDRVTEILAQKFSGVEA